MNKQTWMVVVVGAVSGALGAGMVAGFAGKAFAAQPQGAGKPYVVQVETASLASASGDGGVLYGVLYRVWSDGTVDAVAFYAKPPQRLEGGTTWSGICDGGVAAPAAACYQSLGLVPPDPGSPADVNNDGIVDGADMGLLLGDWDAAASAR